MATPASFGKSVDEKDASIRNISTESPRIYSSPASDIDETYDIYKQHAGEEIDPLEAKKVLRKIDVRLIPVLFLLYLLQYLDKNGINYASVYGLEEGTHLHGQDYSWLSSKQWYMLWLRKTYLRLIRYLLLWIHGRTGKIKTFEDFVGSRKLTMAISSLRRTSCRGSQLASSCPVRRWPGGLFS